MSDWMSSSSLPSPLSPNCMMAHSPMMNSSPEPSFVSGFGESFDDVLDKSFNDLSSHFSAFDSQSCMQPSMSIYDGDSTNNLIIAKSESLYSAFGDPYHPPTNVPWTDLDLEFSAFVNVSFNTTCDPRLERLITCYLHSSSALCCSTNLFGQLGKRLSFVDYLAKFITKYTKSASNSLFFPSLPLVTHLFIPSCKTVLGCESRFRFF